MLESLGENNVFMQQMDDICAVILLFNWRYMRYKEQETISTVSLNITTYYWATQIMLIICENQKIRTYTNNDYLVSRNKSRHISTSASMPTLWTFVYFKHVYLNRWEINATHNRFNTSLSCMLLFRYEGLHTRSPKWIWISCTSRASHIKWQALPDSVLPNDGVECNGSAYRWYTALTALL